ncbi:Dolichyl-diphosphooligosaccharide--protein glycosyltransferase subunit stt-3 [Portunus trituberculatus]|uniref:dolichyl-diphosphooligosaccharide--protein glycotransferase n=1 Tax=Portunus trituberculatus TaxID=210409 RepID=A0A5B7CW87_PORTR|nr:Dolichyl-diphosphooligosaccharide--protein glycosyltransferase subunit stt-3 [Portunus trituberculatus]
MMGRPQTAKASPGMSSPLGVKSLLVFTVLLLAWLAGFLSRLFAVIRFESIIHEFDPWFNYRATAHMVKNGYYNFLNWFDERAWYPLGRIVGGTVYPGLMLTSGSIHYILTMLNIPVHIRDICVFLAPIFSGLTAIATYFLTKEVWSPGAGLFAACFIAVVPGYISRSVAGSYDNEGIAIFALMFTYYLWYLQSVMSRAEFRHFFLVAAGTAAGLVFLVVVGLTWMGVVAPWSGRFYSLWDTGYAKIHIPIIASVSEHQPTTWFSFFFDLHILVPTFPVGLWYCIKTVNDERVFIVLFAVSAVYFAGVMVRLMLTLTPVVCVLGGIVFSRLFEVFLKV